MPGKNFAHKTVLLNEAVDFLNLKERRGIFVDATLGLGGHSALILEKLSEGSRLFGIDRDSESMKTALERVGNNKAFTAVHGNFKDITEIIRQAGAGGIDGILYDLGVSSLHFDDASRGFSFSKDAPLDMRLDRQEKLTADYVVNNYRKEDLERVFKEYGEEPEFRRVADFITKARPIKSTLRLAEVIAGAKRKRGEKINPATRVFQALRIEVNNELAAIKESLESVPGILNPGGRIVVISFHSLEDRIVKQFFNREAMECVCEDKRAPCSCGHKALLKVLTKKPVEAGHEETIMNPRARSAKLRAAEKI